MKTSPLSSKSIDKNYLLRLLNGNSEMMGVVLNEILQNIPTCIAEINSSIKANDHLGIITFAPRVKSAFSMLGEAQLALTFEAIEVSARKGEMSAVKDLFEAALHESVGKIHIIQEGV